MDERVGIVLKNKTGQAMTYYDVETISVNTTISGQTQVYTKGQAFENVPVELNFADGNDQLIAAPDGTLIKSAIIERPDGLIPEHIKKGIEVAGVEGNFAGDIVDKTIDLDFSNLSDMVVEADEDTVMSKVTIVKPDALAPENIAKDVNIAGVVGTHTCNPCWEPYWIDDVCFWDYDGTLILNVPMKDIKNLSELPTPPEHEGLLFREWNYTLEELRAAEYPRDVGATYSSADGKTHATLVITSASYLTVPVYFSQTVANGVTISWGDGSTSTVAGTGSVNTTHKYSKVGTYELVFTVSDGCVCTIGNAGSTYAFIGGSNSSYRPYLTSLVIGDGIGMEQYSINYNTNLLALVVPPGITNWPKYVASSHNKLNAVIVPRGVTMIGDYAISHIGGYANEADCRVISLPETVNSLGLDSLQASCDVLRIVIPSKIIEIPNYCLYNCYSAMRVFLPDSITKFGASVLYNAHNLKKFNMPSSLTTIGDNFGSYSKIRDVVIPEGVHTIGNYFLNQTRLERVIVKGTITSIGTYTFGSTNHVSDIICMQTEYLDVIRKIYAGSGAGYYRRAYVPDEYLDAYINTASSDYKARIYPLSKYQGTIPD